ncbi:hypothetical protein JK386_02015 [Nocardioides sp. zg-536]|uniref:Uncharacterized protein n=1 Tax=Nocardioides faecalis TaxID=2803858 RepID=A0A938Y6A5_9ACTN|nr:hypothetical protein [Nocardioides faecalis]MBM9458670.1 hypothetical protein [Nocardioides faecalis]MBS4753004.1 hypothetical protein [Nocardioides faecalis]QVI58663.1 hypothetical protein KG111_17110 [Nocardioides faecalis]
MLPVDVEQRPTLIAVATLVVVTTLVVFGLTSPYLIRRLVLEMHSPEEQRDEFFTLMKQLAADTTEHSARWRSSRSTVSASPLRS